VSEIYSWSETAASNNSAVPNGWPEGQLPSTVNDCAREMMAALNRDWNRSHVTISSTGSANAYVLTYSNAPTLTHGMIFSFKANFANTGTATANVNSLGAVSIVLVDGASALTTGDILVNQHVVLSYDSALGKMVMLSPRGSAAGPVGDHAVVVHTGNGHGSTNNKIRRFTTTMTNTGTAITYADSAANGGSFTINETGFYAIIYRDFYSAANAQYGVTVNSAQLTTTITSTAVANRLGAVGESAGVAANFSCVERFTAGDVIRAHTSGTPDGATDLVKFSIRKVGNT